MKRGAPQPVEVVDDDDDVVVIDTKKHRPNAENKRTEVHSHQNKRVNRGETRRRSENGREEGSEVEHKDDKFQVGSKVRGMRGERRRTDEDDEMWNSDDGVEPTEHLSSGLQNKVRYSVKSKECPYLSTINRNLLDFDFEKVCSITSTKEHVYGCLVCGKYMQGRGKETHAFTHALTEQHFLFIHLSTAKVYCLPDNYEVDDASLADVKANLNPQYTKEDVAKLDKVLIHAKALDGTDFIPGLVGMNSANDSTDYASVIVQMLKCAKPLRNMLLLSDYSKKQKPDEVLLTFSDLIKKIYNPKNFKGIVSPHEFLQASHVVSGKQFTLMKRSNAIDFLNWLLNHLHHKTRRNKSLKSKDIESVPIRQQESVINGCFNGVVMRWKSRSEYEHIPFYTLSVEVPEAPVFKSDLNTSNQEVHIFDLLDKLTTKSKLTISKLPPYLLLHVKQFSKNNFFLEKNQTQVKFPIKDLNLFEYIDPDAYEENPVTTYDLVANIVHVGDAVKGSYKLQLFHDPSGEWYEIEDLRVSPIMAHQAAGSTEGEDPVTAQRSGAETHRDAQVKTLKVEVPPMDVKTENELASRVKTGEESAQPVEAAQPSAETVQSERESVQESKKGTQVGAHVDGEGVDEHDEDGANVRVLGEEEGLSEECLGEDAFAAFLSDVRTSGLDDPTKLFVPKKSSGILIKPEEEKEKDAGRVEVNEVVVEWETGAKEVERILSLRQGASHFEMFKLPPYASEELIKKHYKKLSVLIHPDKCRHDMAKDAFHLLNTAYGELLKPEYRSRYAGVIDEAKKQVLDAIIAENKVRKRRGMDLLPTDNDSIRDQVIRKCEDIVKRVEEKLSYAEQTRRQNKEREEMMKAQTQAEEMQREMDKKKWINDRDSRVDAWRSYKNHGNIKRTRTDELRTEVAGGTNAWAAWAGTGSQHKRAGVDESYKRAWR